MPALTRTRLNEVDKVIEQVESLIAGPVGGSSIPFVAAMKDLERHVGEMNAALAEARKWLEQGLRDEALSMHDPHFMSVARRLQALARGDWTRVQSLMLEHAMAAPKQLDGRTVDALDKAAEEVAMFQHRLDHIRRLSLERTGCLEKLPYLWDLRQHDAGSDIWPATVGLHERYCLEELRKEADVLTRNGDIDGLARVEATLADTRWQESAPPALLAMVAGAGLVLSLRSTVADAASAATHLKAVEPSLSIRDADVAAAIAAAHRIQAAVPTAEGLIDGLRRGYPGMMRLVHPDFDDAACRRIRDGLRPLLDNIARIEMEQGLRASFAASCAQLEYLCDHDPDRDGEAKWMADVQKAEMEVRRCCQELSDLTVSPLLAERVQRAVDGVEQRQAIRQRFVTLMAVSGVIAILGVTAITGWWLWQWREWSHHQARLDEAVEQAKAGWLETLPDWLRPGEGSADAAAARDIEAGIQAEDDRTTRFTTLIGDVREALNELDDDIDLRREGGGNGLGPWPASFARAAAALSDARQYGGLPSKRGVDPGIEPAGKVPPNVAEKWEREEKDLADVEQVLAAKDQLLEADAQKTLNGTVESLTKRLDSIGKSDMAAIRAEVAALRTSAKADKIEGAMPAGLRRQRASEKDVISVDVLERRLRKSDDAAKQDVSREE